MKDTRYELLVVIASQGYSDMIMDAARKAKAAGYRDSWNAPAGIAAKNQFPNTRY